MASVIEIIFSTRFDIQTHLWCDVILRTERSLSRELHSVSLGILFLYSLFFGIILHIVISLSTSHHVSMEASTLPEFIIQSHRNTHIMKYLMNIVVTTWCVWIKIRRSACIYQARAQRQTRCNAKGYLQTYGNRSMMLGFHLLVSLNRLIRCQEILFSIYASSRWIRDDTRQRFSHHAMTIITIAS